MLISPRPKAKIKRYARSPLAWFGGKYRLAPLIVSLFPPHSSYVEVFGGGAHVLFCKPPGGLEVYNDLDHGVVDFFRVVRDERKCRRLVKLLRLTPYSREEYRRCRVGWATERDIVERVRQWFVVSQQSFGKQFNKSWGFNSAGDRRATTDWCSGIQRVSAACDRLMAAQIEHADFRRIIKTYDRDTALLFVDPPYVAATRTFGKYQKELSDADHLDLVAMLLQIKGKAILSGYDTPLYRDLELAGWQKITIPHKSCTANNRENIRRGTRKERFECLWISPNIPIDWSKLDIIDPTT